jgi:glycosyltransferase involved in cell wall biosynthesis
MIKYSLHKSTNKVKKVIDLDIVIVTKDRPKKLLNSIVSINQLKLKPKSVIVIDTSSEINKSYTLQSIQNLKKSIEIQHYFISNKGLAFSRNFGINKVKAKYFSFLDDDEIVTNDYIEQLSLELVLFKRDVICGHPKIMFPTNYFNLVWSEIWPPDKKREIKENFLIPTSISAFSTSFIKSNNIGFNEQMTFAGEEEEFSGKVFKCKAKCLYTPKFYVYHEFRTDLFSFCKQFFVYGKAAKELDKVQNINAPNLKIRISKKVKGSIIFLPGHMLKELSFKIGYFFG